MSNIKVISPCFYPSKDPAELMLLSAWQNKITVELYGLGKPFITHGADAQVLKLYEELNHVNEYLTLVTDCADVLFLSDLTEIERKFLIEGTSLLMSTETGCWPYNEEVLHGMPDPDTPYRYVNAGQYIGETQYIRYCLKHLLDHYRGTTGLDNSQPWWPLTLIRGELNFKLDSTCQVFQTMSGGADSHVKIQKGRLYNYLTDSWPCLVHFNGDQSRSGQRKLFKELYV